MSIARVAIIIIRRRNRVAIIIIIIIIRRKRINTLTGTMHLKSLTLTPYSRLDALLQEGEKNPEIMRSKLSEAWQQIETAA